MNTNSTFGKPHSPWLVRNAIPQEDLQVLDQEGFEANGGKSTSEAVFEKVFDSVMGTTRVETVAYNFHEKLWTGKVQDHAGELTWGPEALREVLDGIQNDRTRTLLANTQDASRPERVATSAPTGLRASAATLKDTEADQLERFRKAMTPEPWAANAAGGIYNKEAERTIGQIAKGDPNIPSMPSLEEADANLRAALATPAMFRALMQAYALTFYYAQRVPLEDESRLGYTSILNTLREGLRATGYDKSLANTRQEGDER